MLQLVLAALLLAEAARLAACSPIRGDAAASLDDDIDLMKYLDANPETLEELFSKTHTVREGDMVESVDRNVVGVAWPTHVIPYDINPNLASRRGDVVAAIAMVTQRTCMSFPKRTSEVHYLHFENSQGCASFVGFAGGKQSMYIGPTCIVGNIAHEILHALGFHHEHTRMDRDRYVQVLTQNIMPGMEKNFVKLDGNTFGLDYDVTSILHYGSTFFSANGQPTIVASGAAGDMGQRTRMTQKDVQRVGLLYNCDSVHDTEEEQTAAPSSSVTLQPLNATTRGQNGTSGWMDPSYH